MDNIDLPAEITPDLRDDPPIVRYTARRLLQAFDQFYDEFCQIPQLARDAFESRNHVAALRLSQHRIKLYSDSISSLEPNLRSLLPEDTETEWFWESVESQYLTLIQGRYEADLAHAYLHSFRRVMHRVEWESVEYRLVSNDTHPASRVFQHIDISGGVTASHVTQILDAPGKSNEIDWHDDTHSQVLQRLTDLTHKPVTSTQNTAQTAEAAPVAIEMISAGFYRNRGGYLVGRLVYEDHEPEPLIFALLNSDQGIYVDAIINTAADAHNIFSSTLANFHVTSIYYHELCDFLHTIMPSRPLGLHYSTIGYNHFGKLAVINELRDELTDESRRLTHAIGNQGTVAIGFASPRSAYNLKVIRNKPTAAYKWGEFHGIDAVLAKYRRVHEINRTGSMLDNIIFYNVTFERKHFDPDLLNLLLDESSDTVTCTDADSVLFQHLIVQRRMTPLPVFLESAGDKDAETVVNNLGFCIKNNAAANIFNKDLDARNYGVSRFMKVYLYDYDALEPFVDVKLRTNLGREDGEDDVPDWYFEEGVVFLPEEIEAGLMLSHREDRRSFRHFHGDLLTLTWWQNIQQELSQGKVPGIRVYPESHSLSVTIDDKQDDADFFEQT